jgi:hypothetical protein
MVGELLRYRCRVEREGLFRRGHVDGCREAPKRVVCLLKFW